MESKIKAELTITFSGEVPISISRSWERVRISPCSSGKLKVRDKGELGAFNQPNSWEELRCFHKGFLWDPLCTLGLPHPVPSIRAHQPLRGCAEPIGLTASQTDTMRCQRVAETLPRLAAPTEALTCLFPQATGHSLNLASEGKSHTVK